jgi:uncharacterized protein with HEPN domain
MPCHPSPQERHLLEILNAAHRTAFFLSASMRKFDWPITEAFLADNQKELAVFEPLAAINERFGKLQDLLGSGMRHACMLLGEPTEPFLKVLAFFAKAGVVPSSEEWMAIRQLRNAAAHDYSGQFADTARHFNTLHTACPVLMETLQRLTEYVGQQLGFTWDGDPTQA